MSYCVNCGVELDQTHTNCPLCDCPVVNPMKPGVDGAPSPHPKQVEHIDNLPERRFAALIITIISLFVSLICLSIDVSFSGGLSWSRYVLASIGLIWLLVTAPLFSQKMGPLLGIAIDSGAVALYLYGIESWSMPGRWFFPLAFPIIGTAFFALMIGAGLIGSRLIKGLHVPALIFFATGLFVLCIEPVINSYHGGKAGLAWSWFVFIPCTLVALLLTVLERKHTLKEILAKRFHI